jgi:hypothetical protein
MKYSVRIDRSTSTTDEPMFRFEVTLLGPDGDPRNEVVALDSVPGVIAILNAESPGHAAQEAWSRALRQFGEVYMKTWQKSQAKELEP